MKYFIILPALIFLQILSASGQDSTKSNRIIYGDLGGGLAFGKTAGIDGTISLNYQVHNALFTLRFTGMQYFSGSSVALTPFTVFPTFQNEGSFLEYGALYGRRIVDGGTSFSFSAGASLNVGSFVYHTGKNQEQHVQGNYVGLPFEATVLWFKPKKERYRIYYLIPVGQPTGFGKSIGFKLSGNISQHGYVALGVVLGWGYFKQY